MSTRYASVLGLAFGDCGKGHFIDALARRWQAHSVVRFNGGAQAGHNVVTPADSSGPSRHHTFSQFAAATFVPGVRTLLVDPMIVHPTALLKEAEALARIGVNDALARLAIDSQCRVTTPFHQAAGRLRELLRGAAAHGTCGVGVGETVRHGLENPGQELRYSHLAHSFDRQTALDRLQAIRETFLAELLPQCPDPSSEALDGELHALKDATLAEKWLIPARALARQCPPRSAEEIRSQLIREGCVLFEGAQGMLLDESRGFHPHTTWSSVGPAAVNRVAARFGIEAPIEHYGVLRAYLTRHGPGPLPTHDPVLDELLPEPHNSGHGWQGPFRRAHPDAVLLRYALESAGPLSGLLISHLDVFRRGIPLKWCDRYSVDPAIPPWPPVVERLPLSESGHLARQLALTRLLQNARPLCHPNPIRTEHEFLDRLASVTSLPIAFRSRGTSCNDVSGDR